MCQRIGRPPISTIGLGRITVSSLSRVPRPPARITAFIVLSAPPDDRHPPAPCPVAWLPPRKSAAAEPPSARIQRLAQPQKHRLCRLRRDERPSLPLRHRAALRVPLRLR